MDTSLLAESKKLESCWSHCKLRVLGNEIGLDSHASPSILFSQQDQNDGGLMDIFEKECEKVKLN
jgi:hypothetical protein